MRRPTGLSCAMSCIFPDVDLGHRRGGKQEEGGKDGFHGYNLSGNLKCENAQPGLRIRGVSNRTGQASVLSMALQASTRPLTASTDLSIIACSDGFSLISTIRSIPPAPMIVGTPTYIPSNP